MKILGFEISRTPRSQQAVVTDDVAPVETIDTDFEEVTDDTQIIQQESTEITRYRDHELNRAIPSELSMFPSARISNDSYVDSYVLSFNGEKNYGDLGPIIEYIMDYYGLNRRSYQAYLESEIAHTVLNRYFTWIVDGGLRLELEPVKELLESEGVNVDKLEDFTRLTEMRWSLWAKSKKASLSGMESLHEQAEGTYKHASIGGDALVVLHYIDGIVKVKVYDGIHINQTITTIKSDGTRIINGVEIDETGRHIGYHIVKAGMTETAFIPAWSKSTGLRRAFLVYGNKYRVDDVRGVPRIAVALETLKKLERYKEATVGSAEERQKIAYQIVHDLNSSGLSPLDDGLAQLSGRTSAKAEIPIDDQNIALRNQVYATTNKQTFNMTRGSELKILESKNELFFKEFYQTNADFICAAMGIPPNVAFSMYNDSFSASRAATKDWEHTMEIERKRFYRQFYSPILAFWFHTEILQGKIQAPGYLEAWQSDNVYVLEAYLNARFTGAKFPHIDPLKEVKAERMKLGKLGEYLPLTHLQSSSEVLMTGEATHNIEQLYRDLESVTKVVEYAKEKGLIPESTESESGGEGEGNNDGSGSE